MSLICFRASVHVAEYLSPLNMTIITELLPVVSVSVLESYDCLSFFDKKWHDRDDACKKLPRSPVGA